MVILSPFPFPSIQGLSLNSAPAHHRNLSSSTMPAATSSSSARKRKHQTTNSAAATPSSPSTDADGDADDGDGDEDADEEYAPQASSSTTKRSSKASGSAPKKSAGGRNVSREALRKANHSMIERRRREKINSALGELRGMVPGLGDSSGGKGGEFKLEVGASATFTLVAYKSDDICRCWNGQLST